MPTAFWEPFGRGEDLIAEEFNAEHAENMKTKSPIYLSLQSLRPPAGKLVCVEKPSPHAKKLTVSSAEKMMI